MDSPNQSESLSLDQLSYEEALARLEDVVVHLERGDLSLEQSMQRFEDGIVLSRVCAGKLAHAEAKIQKLVDVGTDICVEALAPPTGEPVEQASR